jgi:hypothetical protein
LMGAKGFWWVIDGNKRNLMRNQGPTPSKDKKHPLGACLRHPIGSPRQKIRNIGAPHMHYPNVFFFRDNLLGQDVWPCGNCF